MSIRDASQLRFAALVATTWNILMGAGAVLIGLIGRAWLTGVEALPNADPENLFPVLAQQHLPPALFGIVVAAIFAAIMSTADSQLLVAASTVVRDVYEKVVRRAAARREAVRYSRLVVTGLVLAALVLGWVADELVFWLVLFAWAGLGATLGPTSILALFWRRTTAAGVYAGLVAGTVTTFVWYFTPALKDRLYELIPAFAAGLVATMVVSLVTPTADGHGRHAARHEGGGEAMRPLAMLATLLTATTAAAATPAAAQTAPTAAPSAARAAQLEPYHPFQQGVAYRIEAVLDEATHVLTGRATLTYVNRSPDSLDRLYFHQYLNAFRPDSDWARYDLRFGDRTFQDLAAREHGFERLSDITAAGRPVRPVYPYAPDSTVFHLELPRPLATGDSVLIRVDWSARLASEPRRQGRAGRHYNWAHWYPRIAVYGRDGWEYRTHIRPGEFNGEFGTYDVTLDLAADQVVGATGVPVEGDPGWASAAVPASEPPALRGDFYGPGPVRSASWTTSRLPAVGASAGGRRTCTTSPGARRPTICTVGALARHADPPPLGADSPRWDAERVLRQQHEALDWLAELFGEYPGPRSP
jgi:hypothetical protein